MPEPILWGIWGVVVVGLAVAVLEDEQGRLTNMFVGALGLVSLGMMVIDPISTYLNLWFGTFAVGYGVLGFRPKIGQIVLGVSFIVAIVGGVMSGASVIAIIGFATLPLLFIAKTQLEADNTVR